METNLSHTNLSIKKLEVRCITLFFCSFFSLVFLFIYNIYTFRRLLYCLHSDESWTAVYWEIWCCKELACGRRKCEIWVTFETGGVADTRPVWVTWPV